MSEEGYNGYKNWDTWVVALWLENDSKETYEYARKLAKAGRSLKDFAKSIGITDRPNWSKVSWREVRESLASD